MDEPKIKPSQTWFGFDDPELKTPAHDALVLWIDEYISEILVEVLGLDAEPEIIMKEWEEPILNKRGFVAGVPDLTVRIRAPGDDNAARSRDHGRGEDISRPFPAAAGFIPNG